MKLLVIGADGFNYEDAIKHCPFIMGLAEKGVYGILRSKIWGEEIPATLLPHTGPCWMTIYTGLEPSQHGVTKGGWIQGDVHFPDHYEKTIFKILSDNGFKVGSLEMPVTYPVNEIKNGWMVAGFPAHSWDLMFRPNNLRQYMPDEWIPTGYIVDKHVEKNTPFSLLFEEAEKHKLTFLKKVTKVIPTDVLFYGTSTLDVVGHFQGRTDKFIYAYKMVDKLVETLVNDYKPERIIICADHGFERDKLRHGFEGFYLLNGIGLKKNYQTEKPIIDITPIIMNWLKIRPKPYLEKCVREYREKYRDEF